MQNWKLGILHKSMHFPSLPRNHVLPLRPLGSTTISQTQSSHFPRRSLKCQKQATSSGTCKLCKQAVGQNADFQVPFWDKTTLLQPVLKALKGMLNQGSLPVQGFGPLPFRSSQCTHSGHLRSREGNGNRMNSRTSLRTFSKSLKQTIST